MHLSTRFGYVWVIQSDHLLLKWHSSYRPGGCCWINFDILHVGVPSVFANWTYPSWKGSVIRSPVWCWCHSWILFQGLHNTKDSWEWGDPTGSRSAPYQALGASLLLFSSGHWVWHGMTKGGQNFDVSLPNVADIDHSFVAKAGVAGLRCSELTNL